MMGSPHRHARLCIGVLLTAWILGFPAAAGPLEDVQDATLYVKILLGKTLMGSGSGFLVKTTKQDTYVVTNCHVAVPDDIRTPVTLVGVFHSGTPQEKSLPLQVLAVDPVADLALLRGEGQPGLPKPIRLADAAAPKIGEDLSVIGFPFGSELVLDEHKENPVVSVSRVTVQRAYHDQFGLFPEIPTVGNANHGNSGGPVVDSRGRLAGVLVAGSRLERHGVMIIPAQHVRNLWDGNCQLADVKLVSSYSTKLHTEFTVYRCDPFDTVASARVVMLPSERVTPEMDLEAFHRQAADYFAQDVEVPPMSDGKLTCTATVDVLGTKMQSLSCAVQGTRRDGSTWLSRPVAVLWSGTATADSLELDLSAADAYLQAETPEPSAALPDDDTRVDAYGAGKLGKTVSFVLSERENLRILQLDKTIKPSLAPVWEAGGETALVLDTDGWLLRVALPSFERIDACRTPACLPSHLVPGGDLRTVGETQPVALARSRDHVVVLSRIAYDTLTMGRQAWVSVFDPQRLTNTGFFAVPGVVGISALPDSERLLVRYFTGELGLLDATTGEIRRLCRTRQTTGLPVADEDNVPVIPVASILDAVLVASGNRILIQTEGGVAALDLTPDGQVVPPGKEPRTWPGLAAIRYTPGAAAALLVPSYKPEETSLRPQLAHLPDLRCTALAPGDWQCLDPIAKQALRMQAHKGRYEIERLDLSTGLATKTSWREKQQEGGSTMTVRWAVSAIVPHPRGNAYWAQCKGRACWIEFGPAWAKTSSATEDDSSPAPAKAKQQPTVIDNKTRSPKGFTLGKAGDMTVRLFPSAEQDGLGVGLCWTKGGNAFVAAWRSGIVREIRLEDLTLQSQHDLGKPCLSLGRSALGPVATLASDKCVELAVLGEKTLAPLRTVQLPAGARVSLAERANIALAATPGTGLAVVDLAQGQVRFGTRKIRTPNGQDELPVDTVSAMALAPDGKTAYVVIEGKVAVLQITSERLVLRGLVPGEPNVQATGVAVSPDGYYLDVEIGTGPTTRHVIRSTADPRQVLQELATHQVVFDSGARHLFYRPADPSPYYPFVGRNSFRGEPKGRLREFVAGSHVMAHPQGNLLVTLGKELHVLEYTWGCR